MCAAISSGVQDFFAAKSQGPAFTAENTASKFVIFVVITIIHTCYKESNIFFLQIFAVKFVCVPMFFPFERSLRPSFSDL